MNFASSDIFRASVIAARKSICVSGRFRGLPPTKGRETERRKAHLGNGRGLFPGLPRNRGTRQRLSASRRDVLKPWSVLPGTWQTPERVLEHGIFAPLACPRPASSQWQTLFKGRTETQGLPGPCLRGTSPGAASTFGLPFRPALALPHFSNASRSAPHRTGQGQDKGGLGDGDKE